MTDRTLPPAATSMDYRLDAVIAELRGLRADLERYPVAVRQRIDRLTDDVSALAVADGETVELREPEPQTRAKKARR